MASGFILGIGFVTGGIGVPVTGALADRYGTPEAMMISASLAIVAGLLAFLIPRRVISPEPGVVAGPAG